jgi:EmrB/QacA subfamily drug resistance transporter
MTPQRSALVTLVVSSFALPLLLSSVNVALPVLASELRMDAITLSWVQLAFLTSSAATVLSFGRLSDIVGRKRVYTWGMVGLVLSSLLAAAADSAQGLLTARALQGMSAAMVYATQIAILTSVYPPEQRGKAIGTLVSAVYFGLTCGPLIGGWLVSHFGWRAAFLTHLPLAAFVLAFGVPRLRGEWKLDTPGRFDGVGAVLYAGAIVALMVGGANLPTGLGIGLMCSGVLGLVAFDRHQRRQEDPLLDVRLFHTNRVFAMSSLASLLMYATTYSVLVLVSLYLQYLKGFSPSEAGLVMLTQPGISAIVSPLAGRLSDRTEPRVISSIGVLITALGLVALALLTPASSTAYLVGCLLAMGFGFSLFSSPNANAIMSGVERKLYGVAGGVVATMRILGQLGSMGVVAAAFALTLGRTEITPETYGALGDALRLSFVLGALLCVPALWCSLARGRLHAPT